MSEVAVKTLCPIGRRAKSVRHSEYLTVIVQSLLLDGDNIMVANLQLYLGGGPAQGDCQVVGGK
jgi:hypothetical protein